MKYLCYFLSVFILLTTVFSPAVYAASDLPKLSEMNDEECINFIQANEIDIPYDYRDTARCAGFVRKIITLVENDPNYQFAYNYPVTLSFAESIKNAVNRYYGITINNPPENRGAPTAPMTLTDSNIPAGTWIEDIKNYNCYAFALDRIDAFYTPGDICGSEFTFDLSILEMAQVVAMDLCAEGRCSVTVSSIRPTSSNIEDNQTAICIRRTDTNSIDHDFHFMRLMPHVNEWYHKPSDSRVLSYKYEDPATKVWTNERAYSNYVVTSNLITYPSNIYYITFIDSHTFEYMYMGISNGSGCHVSVCTICDSESSALEECVYDVTDRCVYCGAHKAGIPEIMSNSNP